MKQKTPLIHRYIQALLLGLCFLFIYLIWVGSKPMSLSNETKSLINEQTNDDALLVFPGIENTVPDMNEFQEMVSRPLFMEDRQPYVFVEESVDEPDTDPRKRATPKTREEYSLNAVIITPEKRIAIVQPKRGKELQRIALGEMIDDWKLEEVDAREITLTRGSESRTLVLEIKNSVPVKTASKRNQTHQMARGKESSNEQDEPFVKGVDSPEKNDEKNETDEIENKNL